MIVREISLNDPVFAWHYFLNLL